MDNQTRRILLERVKASGFPGSIIDVFKNPVILDDYIAQQQSQQQQPIVAQTPQEQEQGLRPFHQQGQVNQSMAFPNVQPNQSFNTVGMKIPIDINKYNNQGHLVESYKAVPPGITNLPTGPNEGTVIESPAKMQTGGVKKYQTGNWKEYLPNWVNPYNWGVEDYTNKYETWDKAYAAAKRAGLKEIMWNKGPNPGRKNLNYAGTPRQEVGAYGINGQSVNVENSPSQVNLYPPFGEFLPGHVSAMVSAYDQNSASVDYYPIGNMHEGIGRTKNKGEHSYYVYGANKERFTNKSASLPNIFSNASDWNLFTNNCADNVCDAFGIPRSKGIETPSGTLSKIKEKYPATLDVSGRTYDDYVFLYSLLQGQPYEKILSQSKNILGIASSPEIQKSRLGKLLISTVQGALAGEGYDLSKSLKQAGNYDGVYGPETKKALADWQNKNKSKQTGGFYLTAPADATAVRINPLVRALNLEDNSNFNYQGYYNNANKYLSRDIFKGTTLTAQDIAEAAREFYNTNKYEFPVDLLLSQGQMETSLGKKLKSKHNYFNVGNTDSGATRDYNSPKESVLDYMGIMYNDYFQKGKVTVDDLLKENGFVNYRGSRYASNPNYEKELADQRKFINNFLVKKTGGVKKYFVGGLKNRVLYNNSKYKK
jgi:peptidoglycan hydrolase-like protein with peptidoglycan-binding domain/uncharacterized membrane protein (UPF0127 family)